MESFASVARSEVEMPRSTTGGRSPEQDGKTEGIWGDERSDILKPFLGIKMIHSIKGTPGRGSGHRIPWPTHPPKFTKLEYTEPTRREISSNPLTTIS
uniref:Uncharacterized protein K0098G01.7 n=1 Tax=Oryza sativa subsp. indica TaxID=39946 RepID=C8TF81_ORYSI|nr:hypothetical protein [Oryza sativa Indica Group]BAI39830.1 hypothetical protein [Oryza sativa Indica Group]